MADKRPEWQWNIEWWADRVNNFHKEGNQFSGECPCHEDDDMSSLKIKEEDGKVLVHCHAGCDTETEIIPALESTTPEVKAKRMKKNPVTISSTSLPPDEWWVDYTGVPWEVWEKLGCEVSDDSILFTWKSFQVKKSRKAGTKDYEFIPQGIPIPPLWPDVPADLPEVIYLTEGESDCGVARVLGMESYSLTKGAGKFLRGVELRDLEDRGVKEIRFIYDVDQAGGKANKKIRDEVKENSSLKFVSIDLSRLIKPLAGEKDLRDVYLRTSEDDRQALREEIEQLSSQTPGTGLTHVFDFLGSPIEQEGWAVEDVLLKSTLGLLVGYPKIGKTWLALDLGISIATGTPFLNLFESKIQGPVVYIPREDPDYLLWDRFEKVVRSKGISPEFSKGSIEREGKPVTTYHIQWPSRTDVQFFIDQRREFSFTDGAMVEVLRLIEKISNEYGPPALVIFDPILRMMSDLDSYRAEEVSDRIFNEVEKIRNEFGSAIQLVHHTPKRGKDPIGSIGFRAFSENMLLIVDDSPDADGWVKVELEYKSEARRAFKYRLGDLQDDYNIEAERAESFSVTVGNYDTNQAILSFVADNPGKSNKEIAEHLDLNYETVRQATKVLARKGNLKAIKLEGEPGRRGPKPEGYRLNPEYSDD